MIHFIGIAGIMILITTILSIMDMVVTPHGTIQVGVLDGDGVPAGIRPIIVGDGDIRLITVGIVHITHIMDMVDILEAIMELIIIDSDILILTITATDKGDLPAQMWREEQQVQETHQM